MAYALIMTPGCLKKLQSVCLFAGTFIYTDNQINSDPIYIRICDKSAISLIMNSFKRMTVTLLIGVVAIICLIISSVEKKKIELPIPLEFPFTDSDTFSGITINVLNQLINYWSYCILGNRNYHMHSERCGWSNLFRHMLFAQKIY